MQDCNPLLTPLDVNIKLNKSMYLQKKEEEMEMVNTPYQKAVGSLLYLSQCTRLDISYAVNLVSEFNNNPGKSYWCAIKRIFKYLEITTGHKLEYSKSDTNTLIGYCDADWAAGLDERKSTTGCIFFKGKAATTWNSRKQQTVALSTTEV